MTTIKVHLPPEVVCHTLLMGLIKTTSETQCADAGEHSVGREYGGVDLSLVALASGRDGVLYKQARLTQKTQH